MKSNKTQNGSFKNISWPRASILISAFGIGSYGQESKEMYQETMKKADDCIKTSENTLNHTKELLDKVQNQLALKIS